jgi:hypothetical protein
MANLADKSLLNQGNNETVGTALSAFEHDIFAGVVTEDMRREAPPDSLRYIFAIFC